MKLIVAVDEKWGIGKNGDLLKSIPDDMMYYRTVTRGKVVVMGYATLVSLPGSKPAPGRLNIVLSDIPGMRIPGAVVCGSMEQLHRLIGCFEPDDIFDVGGGSMYRQLMPYCSAAHITKMRFDGGADTFIPNLDELSEWSVESESELMEYEGTQYTFTVYRNASPALFPVREKLSSSMSDYFRKKPALELEITCCDDVDYRAELSSVVRAYFRPLADGFVSDDVDRFLGSDESSFEDYLRKNRLIAKAEDVAAVCDSRPDGCTVRASLVKDDLDEFAHYLSDFDFDGIAGRFGVK